MKCGGTPKTSSWYYAGSIKVYCLPEKVLGDNISVSKATVDDMKKAHLITEYKQN